MGCIGHDITHLYMEDLKIVTMSLAVVCFWGLETLLEQVLVLSYRMCVQALSNGTRDRQKSNKFFCSFEGKLLTSSLLLCGGKISGSHISWMGHQIEKHAWAQMSVYRGLY